MRIRSGCIFPGGMRQKKKTGFVCGGFRLGKDAVQQKGKKSGYWKRKKGSILTRIPIMSGAMARISSICAVIRTSGAITVSGKNHT